MKIILPPPRNVSGISLTGGNRKLRSLHREIQLSTAILFFRNISRMKQTVECSDDLNILIERKKLLSNLKNMVEGLVFTYRKRQEFTSIPEVKEVLKTMEYRMQKNKTTKARYSTDNDFRELQKEKMRAWRNNGSNAERERKAAKKRMAKAALWKNFCAGLK